MKDFITKILNFIFPQKCIGCGVSGELLCENCLLKIPEPEDNLGDHAIVPFSYKDKTMKEAIKMLKFKGAFSVASPIAKFMRETVLEELSEKIEMDAVPAGEKVILIPIPMHEKRLQERGYNQAEILAEQMVIKEDKNFTLETDVLFKIKNTESQVTTKDKKSRSHNLKDAFEARNARKIRGKIVILVDDVITTGATMEECAKTLKKAGARKIYHLAAAH